MTLTIPSCIPESFTAGDTVEFTQGSFEIPGGFAAPSDGWGLSVRIIAATPIDASVTDDDAETYTITFAASATELIVTQTVARLVGYVDGSGTYAGRRYKVFDRNVTIEPNIETALADDLKTHAERTLPIIEAAIEGNMSAAIQSYSIGGRSVSKYTPDELLKLRGIYRHEVSLKRTNNATLYHQMVFGARA